MFCNGQRLLERHRFQFPSSWLYIDNIEGEWGAFTDIMKRKDSAIQQQVANLQMKIVQEDRAVESRTSDLLFDWEKNKPVAGNLRPEEALQTLTIYEGKFGRLKDDRDKCVKAKEALELTDSGLLSGSEERLQVALEELQDLKGVWSELHKIWEQIDQMKEQPWLSVQPRKLRQSLDGLLNQLKNLPARLRQYSSYEYVYKLLKTYLKVNLLIIDLKSEALKDRHWKQLMKRLHVSWIPSELTLGHIWAVDLQKNEAVVKDVLLVAQGEMALEEFLKQVWTENYYGSFHCHLNKNDVNACKPLL
uniref:Dynein heavy chain linker domain-containing protein n=1 Tax=Eptatretus burgeri TaxID=7764 RepID=A0A8C4QMG9_EPTBU